MLFYTHSLRGELRSTGVSATALCPGPVDTGFGEAAGFTKEGTEILPRIMWKPPARVAQAGIDGLAAGKAVVVPGRINGVSVPLMARTHPALKRD